MRRKGTPIGQYGSDLAFGVPFIKYIVELYVGPDCDIEIDKEVVKQP
jgi:hypothetical protein